MHTTSGEPGLQSAASDRHHHTPRGHNLDYTIWILYAESESSQQCHSPLGAPWSTGARPFQSIRQTWVRNTTPRHPPSSFNNKSQVHSFSRRKKLDEDTHTSVALVSCMSSSKPRYWRGCVVVDRSPQTQVPGLPVLLLQQQVLGAHPFPSPPSLLLKSYF